MYQSHLAIGILRLLDEQYAIISPLIVDMM